MRSVEIFSTLRESLVHESGMPAHFSWFLRMDPQVRESYGSASWVVDSHAPLLGMLSHEGDELGLHVHMFRWDEDHGAWRSDFGNPAWVFYCIEDSFEAYRRSLHHPCRTTRLGDGWMSNGAIAQLESLGVRFDLTAEPEAPARPSLIPGELASGSLPGYPGIPRFPYRPSVRDFRTPDPRRKEALWIIPMTAGTGEELSGTPGSPRAAGSMEPAGESTAGEAPWRTLNLTLDPRIFRVVVENTLVRARYPYLAFMVRTDFCLHPEELAATRENLALLSQNERDWRLVFATPSEALRLLGI